MTILPEIAAELESIRALSLWKTERPILSPQSSHIEVGDHRQVLNFCANNYLALADHPVVKTQSTGEGERRQVLIVLKR